jgi:hypothetical protein
VLVLLARLLDSSWSVAVADATVTTLFLISLTAFAYLFFATLGVLGLLVEVRLAPEEAALERWLWRDCVLIEWLAPVALDNEYPAARTVLAHAIGEAASNVGLPVATNTARVAAEAGSADEWRDVVGEWASGTREWVVKEVPAGDRPGRFLLLLGEAPGVPADSLRSARRKLLEALVPLAGSVLLVFVVASLLGLAIVQPAEQEAERGTLTQGTEWSNFDVIYWTVTTVTTGGSGDPDPATVRGRTIAMVDMIVGYLMLGIIVGVVGARVAEYLQFRRRYFEQFLGLVQDQRHDTHQRA